jgi:hypothetical protein
MNTKKFTGMAQGSARTDSLRIDQVQDNDFVYAGTVGGTADAIELTTVPTCTPVEGMTIVFIPGSDSTSTVTVDLNGDGATALQYNAAALSGGEVQAGLPARITHDGTQWQLENPYHGYAPQNANVKALAGLTGAADKLPYFTSASAMANADLSSFGRTLIDDASASAARTTLGLAIGTDVQAFDAGLTNMTGAIVAWPTATAPTGWLECDGAAVSRTTYSALFAIIAETYGDGDASTTFNLPDLRGEFIRGFDNGAGNDPDAASRTDRGDATTGDNVGTKQDFAVENATGRLGKVIGDSNTVDGVFAAVSAGTGYGTGGGTLEHVDMDLSTQLQTSTETRPRNVAMMWIIKT